MDNFWSEQEIKNQFIHIGLSMLFSAVFFYYIGFPVAGFLIGCSVEAFQVIRRLVKWYPAKNTDWWHWQDMIRDLFSWASGNIISVFLIINFWSL